MRLLLALFVSAEAAIRAVLTAGGRKRTALKAARDILAALRLRAVGTPERPGAAWNAVADAYRQAARDAQKALGSEASDEPAPLGGRHQRSARRLFVRLAKRLDAAIAHAGTDVERSFSGTGDEIPEVKGFTDRAGRRWDLSVYARMCAQTTAAEAMSEATINRVLDAGGDLVRVSKHPHPRDACTPYEGRVFSISGKSPTFPRLTNAPPYHPNCRHRLRPYRQAEMPRRVARRNRAGEVRIFSTSPAVKVRRGRVYVSERPGEVYVDGEGRVFLNVPEEG